MKTDKNLTEMAVTQSPDNLIALAVETGANPEQLERLFFLKERHDANMAKTAFFEALLWFQNKAPVIEKQKKGHNYNYAPLPAIVSQIQPLLTECGLTYRFEQSHAQDISVTCVVTHILGHSERTSMEAQSDTSGSKNKVQAIGSTVSYLQRYTLIGALGITTADVDTDGVIHHQPISASQYKELVALELKGAVKLGVSAISNSGKKNQNKGIDQSGFSKMKFGS